MLTAKSVRDLFDYDENSGELKWRIATSRVRIGDAAGMIGQHGYRKIGFGGKSYLAHRLIWLHKTGEWPSHEIDHINCVKSDNRWKNLRPATRQQNACNYGANKNSKSGIKGVFLMADGRFLVQIRKNGRKTHVGCFTSKDEARSAYLAAAKIAHGEFARI